MPWQWIVILLLEAVAFWCPPKAAYKKTLWNWVRQCVSAVSEAEREKALDQRDMEHGVRPLGRLNTQSWLAMAGYWATNTWLHFMCFISASHLILHFPNCRTVCSVWLILTLVSIKSLHWRFFPPCWTWWQMVQSADLDKCFHSGLTFLFFFSRYLLSIWWDYVGFTQIAMYCKIALNCIENVTLF